MKNLLIVLLLLLSETGFTAPLSTTIQVEGMTCASCAAAIEKKLEAFSEVDSIEISIQSGQVVLKFKEGKTLSAEQIRDAIKNAGYSVKSMNPN